MRPQPGHPPIPPWRTDHFGPSTPPPPARYDRPCRSLEPAFSPIRAIAIHIFSPAFLVFRMRERIFTHFARALCCRFNRSRRKKYDKEKQGRTGVKIKRGSPLDASPAGQCAACDRGLHRRCDRLGVHCTARQRSPAGVNKRKEGKNSARAARAREPKASAHLRLFSPLDVVSRFVLLPQSDSRGRPRSRRKRHSIGLSRSRRLRIGWHVAGVCYRWQTVS